LKLLTQQVHRSYTEQAVGAESFATSAICENWVIGKGVEPHPTDDLRGSSKNLASSTTIFLSTLEGVMRSLPLSPRHAVRGRQGSQSLLTLHVLLYRKLNGVSS